MITLNSKGVRQLRNTLINMSRMSFDPFLLALAKQVEVKQKTRMARVSGDMVRRTSSGIVRPGHARIVVNVPYASHNNQGRRADGSYIIRNRTSPGEQYWAQKGVRDMRITNAEIGIINDELRKNVIN